MVQSENQQRIDELQIKIDRNKSILNHCHDSLSFIALGGGYIVSVSFLMARLKIETDWWNFFYRPETINAESLIVTAAILAINAVLALKGIAGLIAIREDDNLAPLTWGYATLTLGGLIGLLGGLTIVSYLVIIVSGISYIILGQTVANNATQLEKRMVNLND